MCFGCSKEVSHLEGSFVYPQHTLWLKKNCAFSSGGPSQDVFIWAKPSSSILCECVWGSRMQCRENSSETGGLSEP